MKKLLNILSFIFGLVWIPFFFYDWKIALFVLIVMYANNLMLIAKDYE